MTFQIIIDDEINAYTEHILIYKCIAKVIRSGDQFRLFSPFESSFSSVIYVSPTKEEAVLFVFNINSMHWSNLVPRLNLKGLDKNFEYEICEQLPNNLYQSLGNLKITESNAPIYQLNFEKIILTGEILMSCGLPLKFYSRDDSAMFTFKKIRDVKYLTPYSPSK